MDSLSSGRGLDLRVPKLWARELTPGDFVTWEVLYDDGTLLREDQGAEYAQIDRGKLVSFRLQGSGETLIETFPPPGATGHALLYRRRIAMAPTEAGSYSRRVVQLVGWAPMGPFGVLDAAAMTWRTREDLVWDDEDFQPVTPVACETWEMAQPENPLLQVLGDLTPDA